MGSLVGLAASLALVALALQAHLLVANPDAAPVWREASATLPVAAVETERQRTSGAEVDLG